MTRRADCLRCNHTGPDVTADRYAVPQSNPTRIRPGEMFGLVCVLKIHPQPSCRVAF